ncbi:MAG TPA: hypothetical protein VLM79_23715 [Kofleriaceae bacterium]|nr:hypothetical protein [Kofleriaceae bacterium]
MCNALRRSLDRVPGGLQRTLSRGLDRAELRAQLQRLDEPGLARLTGSQVLAKRIRAPGLELTVGKTGQVGTKAHGYTSRLVVD